MKNYDNHFELVGIPGSGKSTFYKKLLLSTEFCSSFSLTYIYKLMFACLWINEKNSKIDLCIMRFLYRCIKIPFFKKLLLTPYCKKLITFSWLERKSGIRWRNLFLLNMYVQAIAKKNPKRTLQDEGIVQKIISCSIGHKNPGYNIKKLLNTVDLPDKVIFITINKETAYERIVKRGLPERLKYLSENEIRAFICEYEKLLEYACCVLAKKKVDVYRVSSTDLIGEDVYKLNFLSDMVVK